MNTQASTGKAESPANEDAEHAKRTAEVRQYLEIMLRRHPTDEMLRFALALAIREQGDEQGAEEMYDQGLRNLDQLWLPKLAWFGGGSVALTLALVLVGLAWPPILVPALLIGPLCWFWVRQNRHRYIPPIGFSLKDNLANRTDLEETLEELRLEENRKVEGEPVEPKPIPNPATSTESATPPKAAGAAPSDNDKDGTVLPGKKTGDGSKGGG
ncbi:MAG: bacterial transcriptional activator domain-containing protein [Phycisphaeraceae bacterium]|nr:bacterial transcriptional activator domain-containing protein [Phycisphaeraceae bacterium]